MDSGADLQQRSFALTVQMPSRDGGDLTARSDALLSRPDAHQKIVQALLGELYYRSEEPVWQAGPINSLTCIGGSAWLLCPELFARLMDCSREWYDFLPGATVRVEANTAHLNSGTVPMLADAGMTLLMLRQSLFFPATFESTSRSLDRILQNARTRTENFSFAFGFMLTFGLPGQTVTSLRRELEALLRREPCRIELRPRAELQRKRNENVPSFDECLRMREMFRTLLEGCGYVEQEVGRFSIEQKQPPHEDRLQCVATLGVGPGAVTRFESTNGQAVRYENIASIDAYCEAIIRNGRADKMRYLLSRIDQYHEGILIGLNRRPGLRLRQLCDEFGIDIDLVHPGLIDVLVDTGCVERDRDLLRLTDRGTLHADNVIRNFFLSQEDYVWMAWEGKGLEQEALAVKQIDSAA